MSFELEIIKNAMTNLSPADLGELLLMAENANQKMIVTDVEKVRIMTEFGSNKIAIVKHIKRSREVNLNVAMHVYRKYWEV